MKLEDFLDQFVEGYLFSDLRSMSQVSTPAGLPYGAVGYPMVSTTIAGIELLGALTSSSTFDKHRGSVYFRNFWGDMYSDHRRQLGTAVYQLLRHGVAHVFVAKPRITVIKSTEKALHLGTSPSGDLIVNALTLASDLEQTYRTNIASQLATLAPTMQARLDEMVTQFSDQSDAQLPTLNLAVAVDPVLYVAFESNNQSTASSSVNVSCNSPSIQPIISPPPGAPGGPKGE